MHPTHPILLAIAHLPPLPHHDVGEWLNAVDQAVLDAVSHDAQLLLFPAWGGMTGVATATQHATVAALLDPFISRLREAARAHLRYIVAPGLPVEVQGGRFRHRIHLFAPNGALAIQDQLLLDAAQNGAGFEAGESLKCIDTELGRLAILVGEDIRQPGLARACCEAGAWLLLNPCAETQPAATCTNTLAARARASECGCHVAQARWQASAGSSSVGLYTPPLPGLQEDGVVCATDQGGWLMGLADGAALAEGWGAQEAAVAVVDTARPRVVVEESLM